MCIRDRTNRKTDKHRVKHNLLGGGNKISISIYRQSIIKVGRCRGARNSTCAGMTRHCNFKIARSVEIAWSLVFSLLTFTDVIFGSTLGRFVARSELGKRAFRIPLPMKHDIRRLLHRISLTAAHHLKVSTMKLWQQLALNDSWKWYFSVLLFRTPC